MTDNLQTYFAFGLNMESERLQKWCQGATDRGVARLDGYRFRINKRGKATIIPDSAATTYG